MARRFPFLAHSTLTRRSSPCSSVSSCELDFCCFILGFFRTFHFDSKSFDEKNPNQKAIRLNRETLVNKLDGVKRAFVTPSLFKMHQWLDTGIETFLFGGEEPPNNIERTARAPHNAKFWNLYGLTECSVWSSCVPIQSGKNRSPISRSPADIAPGHSFRIERDQLIISCAQPCSLAASVSSPGVSVELSDVDADHVELIDGHIYFVSRQDQSIKRHGQLVSLSAIRAGLLCVNGVRGELLLFATFKEFFSVPRICQWDWRSRRLHRRQWWSGRIRHSSPAWWPTQTRSGGDVENGANASYAQSKARYWGTRTSCPRRAVKVETGEFVATVCRHLQTAHWR